MRLLLLLDALLAVFVAATFLSGAVCSKRNFDILLRKMLFGFARNDQRLYRFFATFFMWNVTYLRCRFWASPASGC